MADCITVDMVNEVKLDVELASSMTVELNYTPDPADAIGLTDDTSNVITE